ncbi:hypothetical protein [Brevundimonas sp. GCM10030266]|uniref:hypothetical protein n=1 Tax=Brevundimonas sp. GCM10030266 TaxID=3273386 RepID=UPI0036163521
MRKLAAVLAALLLAGCMGGADRQDIRCYAISAMGMAQDRTNSDVAVVTAFYLGRLDASDPEGRWGTDLFNVIDDMNRSPPGDAEAAGCVETFRAAMAKQAEATAAYRAGRD